MFCDVLPRLVLYSWQNSVSLTFIPVWAPKLCVVGDQVLWLVALSHSRPLIGPLSSPQDISPTIVSRRRNVTPGSRNILNFFSASIENIGDIYSSYFWQLVCVLLLQTTVRWLSLNTQFGIWSPRGKNRRIFVKIFLLCVGSGGLMIIQF